MRNCFFKKGIYALFLFLLIALSLVYYKSCPPKTIQEKLQSVITRNKECQHIVQLLQQGRVEEAVFHISQALQSHTLRKSHLRIISLFFSNMPLHSALKGTEAVLQLKGTGLTRDVLFPIVYYIETHPKGIAQQELYIPEKRFGRELQYDPETEAFFIHLGTHNVKKIGKGRLKIVTKTILYDRKKPQILARATTKYPVQNEIERMKALKGKPGLILGLSFMDHTDPDTNKTVHTIITPIYNKNSLQKVLDNKEINLSLDEKISIGKQILTGLISMHEGGYTHRDLGARNYLVSVETSKKQKRNITCVIADFGRTCSLDEAHGLEVQGNSNYFAPEGIFAHKMHSNMYTKTDLFAVGCVFWQLYFGTLPSWSAQIKHMINTEEEQNWRYSELVQKLHQAHSSLKKLIEELRQKGKSIQEIKFLELIIEMTKPDPNDRPSSKEIHTILSELEN